MMVANFFDVILLERAYGTCECAFPALNAPLEFTANIRQVMIIVNMLTAVPSPFVRDFVCVDHIYVEYPQSSIQTDHSRQRGSMPHKCEMPTMISCYY